MFDAHRETRNTYVFFRSETTKKVTTLGDLVVDGKILFKRGFEELVKWFDGFIFFR